MKYGIEGTWMCYFLNNELPFKIWVNGQSGLWFWDIMWNNIASHPWFPRCMVTNVAVCYIIINNDFNVKIFEKLSSKYQLSAFSFSQEFFTNATETLSALSAMSLTIKMLKIFSRINSLKINLCNDCKMWLGYKDRQEKKLKSMF